MSAKFVRRRARRSTCRNFRPAVEALEIRSLLAAIVWDGEASDNNWNNAANWFNQTTSTNNVLPGASDDASIGAAFAAQTINHASGTTAIRSLTSAATLAISGGSFAISDNSTAPHVSLSGGSLVGAGSLSITGSFTWSGGHMNSPGTLVIASGASMTISGTADHDMNGHQLANQGTVTWTDGRIRSGNGGRITNANVWLDQSSRDFVHADFGGLPSAFINSGTYTKSGTAAATRFLSGFALQNTGTIDVQTGSLHVQGGGTASGPAIFIAGPTAAINFSLTGFQFNSGVALTGPGPKNLASGTHTISGAITAQNLNLTAGTLAGTHTISGDLTWSGGNMNSSGTTTVAADGTLFISGVGVDHDLRDRNLVNQGTVTWVGGRIRQGSSFRTPSSTDVANDTMDFASPHEWTTGDLVEPAATSGGLLAGSSYFVRAVDADTISLHTTQADAVNNLNRMDLTAAVAAPISERTHVTNAHRWNDQATASFVHNDFGGASSTFINLPTGVYAKLGRVPSATNLITDTVDFPSPHPWTTATAVQVAVSGGGLVQGTVYFVRPFDADTISFHTTATGAANNTDRVDLTDAVAAQVDGRTSLLSNYGLANSGVIDVQIGTLEVIGGGSNGGTGTVNAAAGGTILFSSPSFQFDSGSTLTGAGQKVLAGNSNTLLGAIAARNLHLVAGSLLGTHDITGDFTWSGGNMNTADTTTIASGSTLLISGAIDHDMNRHHLVNHGTVTWTGGRIRAGNGSRITNLGDWLDQSGREFVHNDFGGPASTFVNSGTYSKSGSSGVTAFLNNFGLDNSGTIEVQSGTLRADGGVAQLPASTLTGGTWKVLDNATLVITTGANITANQGHVVLAGANSAFPRINSLAANAAGASFAIQNGRSFTAVGALSNAGHVTVGTGSTLSTTSGNYTQSAGLTTLAGGTLDAAGIVDIRGGMLAGTGTAATNVTSAGLVAPGAGPGRITIEGAYAQSAAGSLNIEIGGTTPATQFDQLVVTSQATLDGTLNISRIGNFTPAATDSFRVLTASPLSGTFAALAGTTFPGGLFIPIYDVTGLTLEANLAPVAVNDSRTVLEDASVAINLIGNDSDPDGDTITVSAVGTAAHGTVVNHGDGTVTYTPAANYSGPDSFTYTLSDAVGLTTTGTVSVTATPVNDPPAFDAIGTQTVPEDSPQQSVAINNVSAGPSSESDQTITFTATSSAPAIVPHPTVSGSGASRTLHYTPAANAHGPVTITVRAQDSGTTADGGVDFLERSFTINVTPVNDPPQAANDTATAAEDGAVTVAVRDNDADIDGDTLSITAVTQPAHGSAVINPGGTVVYTPAPNYHGPDSFTYTVADPSGATSTATVQVTVTPSNDAPIAASDSATTAEDAPVAVAVLANDSDLDGDNLTVVELSDPDHGNVLLNADGTVTYTPDLDYSGPDSFTYRARDGALSSGIATVTLSVLDSENDPPTARDDSAVTDEDLDVLIPVLANDSDPDGNPLSIIETPAVSHGDLFVLPGGVIQYRPRPDSHGPRGFTYTISDGQGGTATATVHVTVNSVNDPPVLEELDIFDATEEVTFRFTAAASDADLPADSLHFSLGPGAPAGATIDPITGFFEWRPTEADGPGEYRIAIRVTDGANPELSDVEAFTLNVVESNQDPVLATIGNQTVDELATLRFTAAATDADLPANELRFRLGPGAPSGASIDPVTGAFDWTPSETSGPGVFPLTVIVSEIGPAPRVDSETISITVREVNAPPVLDTIGNQPIDEGATLRFTATATDPDLPANGLAYSLSGDAPAGATMDHSSGQFAWTPTVPQGPGTYTFAVRVTDSGSPALFDEEFITVTVRGVVSQPLADFGDAPLTFGSSSHLGTGPLLGALRDGEASSQPNDTATGDDASGDDEDGVQLLTALIPQAEAAFAVTAPSGGKLDAWMDSNRDGSFSAAEQFASGLSLAAGVNHVTLSVPAAAAAGATFARFRLSSQGGLGPSGGAQDGEVEDYRLTIAARPPAGRAIVENSTLIVSGTGTNDSVFVDWVTIAYRVRINGRLVATVPLSAVSQIVVFGGAGNDVVVLDSRIAAPAQIFGEAGNDSLIGARGSDQLWGGLGNDTLLGGPGNDQLAGESGNDRLFGDGDHDLLLGGVGNDVLFGGNGNDVILAGAGADRLHGQRGQDLLVGNLTDHDQSALVLHEMVRHWTAPRPFADRVWDLRSLLSPATVLDDRAVDQLYGQGDQDWLLDFSLRDKLRDCCRGDRRN
jgi:hypothetical protein